MEVVGRWAHVVNMVKRWAGVAVMGMKGCEGVTATIAREVEW